MRCVSDRVFTLSLQRRLQLALELAKKRAAAMSAITESESSAADCFAAAAEAHIAAAKQEDVKDRASLGKESTLTLTSLRAAAPTNAQLQTMIIAQAVESVSCPTQFVS